MKRKPRAPRKRTAKDELLPSELLSLLWQLLNHYRRYNMDPAIMKELKDLIDELSARMMEH